MVIFAKRRVTFKKKKQAHKERCMLPGETRVQKENSVFLIGSVEIKKKIPLMEHHS